MSDPENPAPAMSRILAEKLERLFPDPIAGGAVDVKETPYAWALMPGKHVYMTRDGERAHEIVMDWTNYVPVGCTCKDAEYRGAKCKHMQAMVDTLLTEERFMKYVYRG